MVRLSAATLDQIGPDVALPRYDRTALVPGIVHIGVGNFHRTHQALYLEDCLNHAPDEDWGVCGIGLLDGPAARAKAEAYRAQDGLYTVTEFASDGTHRTRVIGVMIDYLHAPADPEAVLDRLAAPTTRIVTLTITEGGYNLDETTGAFRLDTPEVAAELRDGLPRTAFGYLVQALSLRRAAGIGGFTIASCDNLRGNGDTTRRAVLGFAQARDPALARWIETEVDFPNSMVDRIAPQITPEVAQRLNSLSGIDDRMPAMAETFNQWVVQDHFRYGRPRLESVGVEFRENVVDYVSVKGRMINASHMMMAYPSVLKGERLVHEAMRDHRIVTLIGTFLDRDVRPRLAGPPGLSLDGYKAMIVDRFSNPAIGDQVLRVAGDGASKLPIFHGRTLALLKEDGAPMGREAFLLACFARYLVGRDDRGETYPLYEPVLNEADWALIRAEPAGILRAAPFASLELADHPPFRAAFDRYAALLAAEGASRALDAALAEP